MDIKLLIVKAITLIYQESQLGDTKTSIAKPVVKKAMEFVKIPENGVDEGLERNSIVHLRSTLTWMLQCPDSQPYDKNDLLQRLRINLGSDENTYDAFHQSIRDYDDKEKLAQLVIRGKKDLQTFLSKEKAKDILKKASHKMAFKPNEVGDLESFLKMTIGELAEVDAGGTDTKTDPAFVGSIDFGCKDSVTSAFLEMQSTLSSEGVIKMPWIRGNALLGENDGIRRGETHLWNALPHNYKSGLLMDIFIGGCIFNNPFLFDPVKKPALVLFSTEDDLPLIIKKIYVILKQRETGLPVLIKTIDPDNARDYVMEHLTATGWNVFIHRVKPSMFTVTKYISTMEDYKAKGYEVAMVVCDYLAMFSKEGRRADNKGDDIQDLFRSTREYNAAERIAFITAHQLSTDVKALKRINPDNYIHDLPGKGYYEGCRKIDTEVDFEGYINKRIVVNGTYLEILWGKHRGIVPEESNKYFVLKFHESPMYGIMYDFDGEDSSYKVVGGKPNTEGGGKEWFDLEA
jgi:hypothetical protein